MNSLIKLLMVVSLSCLVKAEEIKSTDGRIIKAKVIRITEDGVIVERANRPMVIPWGSIDKEQGRALRAQAWVDVTLDRFTEVRQGRVGKGIMVDGDLEFNAVAGPTNEKDPAFFLGLSCTSKKVRWTKGADIAVLVDGAPCGALKQQADAQVFGALIYTTCSIRFDGVTASKLAEATKIEMRVGQQVLTLPDVAVKRFSDLYWWWKAQN